LQIQIEGWVIDVVVHLQLVHIRIPSRSASEKDNYFVNYIWTVNLDRLNESTNNIIRKMPTIEQGREFETSTAKRDERQI